MWVAKIKFSTKGTLIGSRAEKYKIVLYGYPVSFVKDKDWIKVNVVGRVIGDDKKIRQFCNDLKKQERVLHLEMNNNFMIATIKEPLFLECVYNEKILHVSPAVISHEGYEILNLASFDRKLLEDTYKALKNNSGELLSIKKSKVTGISIMRMSNELTEKQRAAIELAIKHGYYYSPRKITVEQLAKIAKLSFSTYQVHLRKAEAKLMPQLLE
ncbi:TPA: hypothetical protein HA235_04910 [Candidatus Woesearchaeota archaeon]|nr:helix-turn-helix domain-containing protein [Candidatus Woesearchaeota archaeon]HIH32021.1 hypothetical protein [Candidatus Woesearchaeota archaeon]HIH54440.1 hypothetical protein [Candidatus Woesearchaeota archaeon]HIJ01506.1 hypothetical protein [Candidatus Woesearchaeota archaeon]HIJ13487.1 hypothetical protein [Candidatus Woesearchaeota archaeon]